MIVLKGNESFWRPRKWLMKFRSLMADDDADFPYAGNKRPQIADPSR
jgi:hypothetical protein